MMNTIILLLVTYQVKCQVYNLIPTKKKVDVALLQ